MRGKVQIVVNLVCGKQDHPRLCGEKSRSLLWSDTKIGSPPPMRGKGKVRGKSIRPWRITPAYAGKSSRIPRLHLRERDHPRLCGEKSTKSSCPLTQIGSPPPMRGKATTRQPILTTLRITPAYAGKSTDYECRQESKKDHPRLCGEKYFFTNRRNVS